jgi:hypothetical protein
MSDLLSELKAACRSESERPERERIAEGPATWFHGRPARAPEGTIALAGGDAVVIVNETDVRAVEKDGDDYRVAVSADAHVLLRIEKLLKATPTSDCGCGDASTPGTTTTARDKKDGPITIEIGPITVCKHLCGWVDLIGHLVYVCVDVDCHVEKKK